MRCILTFWRQFMCQLHNIKQCFGYVVEEEEEPWEGLSASWHLIHSGHYRLCKYLLTLLVCCRKPQLYNSSVSSTHTVNERQHRSCCLHPLCLLSQIKIFGNWVRVAPFLVSPTLALLSVLSRYFPRTSSSPRRWVTAASHDHWGIPLPSAFGCHHTGFLGWVLASVLG